MLQSMGSQRVRHNLATEHTHTHTNTPTHTYTLTDCKLTILEKVWFIISGLEKILRPKNVNKIAHMRTSTTQDEKCLLCHISFEMFPQKK